MVSTDDLETLLLATFMVLKTKEYVQQLYTFYGIPFNF